MDKDSRLQLLYNIQKRQTLLHLKLQHLCNQTILSKIH